MNPLATAAIGAAVLVVPLAVVGGVFVAVWAIEGRERRRNQVSILKSTPTLAPADLAAFRRAAKR